MTLTWHYISLYPTLSVYFVFCDKVSYSFSIQVIIGPPGDLAVDLLLILHAVEHGLDCPARRQEIALEPQDDIHGLTRRQIERGIFFDDPPIPLQFEAVGHLFELSAAHPNLDGLITLVAEGKDPN
jgi:hypothetical protein